MKFMIVILAVLGFSARSCTSGQKLSKTGDTEVIDFRFAQFNHADTFLRFPFWDRASRVWRKNDLAIEEVRYVKINSDSKGSTTTYPVMHYRFTNLRTMTVCEFSSFSDTAILKKKYIQTDTGKVAGGWGFSLNRRLSDSAVVTPLPDTMINGRGYGRTLYNQRMNGIDYVYDGWFLKEKKVTRFSLDQAGYERTGMPLVGYHLYPQGKRGLKAVVEVLFIADTLTAEEERVFEAWEKQMQAITENREQVKEKR